MKKLTYPLILITLLVAFALACGTSNTGTKLESKPDAPTSTPVPIQTYKVGDLIQVENHTIVLNSAELKSGRLQANFTIENKGSSELAVSSLLSFEAKDTEGVKLEQDIFDCSPGLDGSVLAGDKLKGNICWKGATVDTVKIYYKANVFGSGAIVWEVK